MTVMVVVVAVLSCFEVACALVCMSAKAMCSCVVTCMYEQRQVDVVSCLPFPSPWKAQCMHRVSFYDEFRCEERGGGYI